MALASKAWYGWQARCGLSPGSSRGLPSWSPSCSVTMVRGPSYFLLPPPKKIRIGRGSPGADFSPCSSGGESEEQGPVPMSPCPPGLAETPLGCRPRVSPGHLLQLQEREWPHRRCSSSTRDLWGGSPCPVWCWLWGPSVDLAAEAHMSANILAVPFLCAHPLGTPPDRATSALTTWARAQLGVCTVCVISSSR